jgi:hypothetical protein
MSSSSSAKTSSSRTREPALVARAAFVLLVAATFGAFFLAQRLKSAPPVIHVGGLARYFSPERRANAFSVTLKVSDDLTVDVVNLDGDRVRRLADAVHATAHRPVRLAWDGRTDDGARAPDGEYRVRVALRNEGRSTVIQKTMSLDTKPPRSEVCVGAPCRPEPKALPNIVAPGKPVKVYVRGVSTAYVTRFTVLRTDQGAPTQVGGFTLKRGLHERTWDGASSLPPGVYLFRATVRDRAGNVGVTPARVEVGAVPGRPGLTVRGLAVQPPLRPVTAGQMADFLIDSRGAPYIWRVRRVGESAVRKRGRGTGPNLSLRAPPGASGAYVLQVTAGRWHATVPFLVQAATRSPVLVVVPMISWLGTDEVDDPPFDGVPNSLSDGASVHWPRVLVQNGGLPRQFSDDVAKLLIFLDRRHIRYDLTSDLDLDLSRNPRASDRPGVLLAGPETWVTRPLARRLRRYVLDGGRLASFGADSLRRGVTLRAGADEDVGVLTQPTQPTSADTFGAHLAKPRKPSAPASLIQLEGPASYGLMTGVNQLPGFTQLEESAPVTGAHEKLLVSVGQPLTDAEQAAAEQSGKPARELRPALTAVQLGKGLVIRVGLPEWYARLVDPQVAQATRNIFDLLRGVTPKIRSER